MHRIYNKDGSYQDYSDEEVKVITITNDNLDKLENEEDGVRIFFKDGTSEFFKGAYTDGQSLEFN